MLIVTSFLIRLTLLETYNYFPLNIYIELSVPALIEHTHRIKLFPLVYKL
jgi:hypothetical protein